MLMNYARACNPYSGFFTPVNGTSTIGHAEKALSSGLSRHVSHYGLRIKDGRKIEVCGLCEWTDLKNIKYWTITSGK
ncbi:MAG: hypothetical protein LKE99_11390 [Lachnospiraceae bacterium]|jgi:hypothetical protein|nr:hypothetical protein [Lachnospiraceae bacterium]MCH4103978.1 hypothetical protein [Lachnospiraceae bacterium]